MLNSVNNNSNQTSFKAFLKVSEPIDKTRLKNIQKIFSQKTSDIKDTLTVSHIGKGEDKEEVYYLGQDYAKGTWGSLKTSFADMMENLSDNEIATKLAKVAGALKVISVREFLSSDSDSEALRYQQEKKRCLKISEIFVSKGNELMASRFRGLAGIYDKKLDQFNKRQQNIDNYYLKKLKTIADGDKEILEFKNLMLS